MTDGVLIFLMTPDDILCAVTQYLLNSYSKKFEFMLQKGLLVIFSMSYICLLNGWHQQGQLNSTSKL